MCHAINTNLTYSQQPNSVSEPGSSVMPVDDKGDDRMEHDLSYASRTGSHQLFSEGMPAKKKKHQLRGKLKHFFRRKNESARPPPVSDFVGEPVLVWLNSLQALPAPVLDDSLENTFESTSPCLGDSGLPVIPPSYLPTPASTLSISPSDSASISRLPRSQAPNSVR